MKATETVERIRKQRRQLAVAQMRREIDELVEHHEEERRKHDEWMARSADFNREMSLLTQLACTPFVTPAYLDEIRQRADRLCNEHGVRRDTPKPSLKVVGGSK